MKTILLVLLLAVLSCSLPYIDKVTLANSLIVGRDDQSDLKDWTCKVCADQTKPIEAHIIQETNVDVKCIVTQYDNFIVLAFRYTNTALNIWQDILYPLQIVDQHTCSKCKVQKAYNNMWETIKQDVFNYLKDIQKSTGIQTLHITGISLGGGLATIAFIDINHEQIFDVIDITTYGAPRVGNRDWAEHFDLITLGRTRRVIVDGDPIVVMPKCLTLLCNYQQTGIEIVCKQGTQTCTQEASSPDYNKKAIKYLTRHGYNSIIDHVDGYPKIYNFTLIIE